MTRYAPQETFSIPAGGPYPIRYELVDGRTGQVLGTYTYAQRNRGRNRRDKLDLEHGSCRYVMRPVWS